MMRLCLVMVVMAVLAGCAGRHVGNPNMVNRTPGYVWPEANQLDLDNLPVTH